MPKLKQSQEQDANNHLLAILKKYQQLTGVSRYDLAAAMKISDATYYNRMKSPEDMTVSELRNVIRKMRIPREEVLEMLFGNSATA